MRLNSVQMRPYEPQNDFFSSDPQSSRNHVVALSHEMQLWRTILNWLSAMAYLHRQIQIPIPTPIRTENEITTL